jgi:hypothetical protein
MNGMSSCPRCMDNDCHTNSRSYCYKNEDKRKELKERPYMLQYAHLFKDAVPCVENIFKYYNPYNINANEQI